jgi:hypothetical protein
MAKSKRTFYKKKPIAQAPPEAKPLRFPSISRWIPEVQVPALPAIFEKELVVGFLCGCLVVAILFSGIRVYTLLQVYEGVVREKVALIKQKSYWQDVTRQYPQYRDAHFRLGVLAYQEGNATEARAEVRKALELDPSFTEARVFLEKVEK